MNATDGRRRYFWALLSPSALDSVAYLHSAFATSAATELEAGQYLALVVNAKPYTPPEGPPVYSTLAYLVQPCDSPIPLTCLPIAPYRVGSREPLVPDFEWPFGDCVINTGKIFSCELVLPDVEALSNARFLSADAARYFNSIQSEDHSVQILKDYEIRTAGRDATGSDDHGLWTTFSHSSTQAEIVPMSFFPPTSISVKICLKIESLERVLPASQCFEDERNVKRLRARFSRPSTARTITWTLNQAACTVEPLPQANTSEFENTVLFDFSSTFERPLTPDVTEPAPPEDVEEYYDDEPGLGDGWLERIAWYKIPVPALFEPHALQIIYFDVYGTLIDHETGIFDALGSLLSRCSHQLERREALSFYFESESEVKERQPSIHYLMILAEAHRNMALRLGISIIAAESSKFASSLFDWPIFDDAILCLRSLQPYIPTLVALVELDAETLCKTAAYHTLGGYFCEIFTWDQSKGYRPNVDAYDPPLIYHDNCDIPREQRLHVSSALFRDLELVAEVDIPTVWMRCPGRLAADVPLEDASFAWKVCDTLPQLASDILSAKSATPRNFTSCNATLVEIFSMPFTPTVNGHNDS
ncbi:hypothetical protein C8R47DRAFT_1288372 [Mycena vitilis]|nr:hypothetical protein C8R47DRAFT_1288372 [Mycena vitilis]